MSNTTINSIFKDILSVSTNRNYITSTPAILPLDKYFQKEHKLIIPAKQYDLTGKEKSYELVELAVHTTEKSYEFFDGSIKWQIVSITDGDPSAFCMYFVDKVKYYNTTYDVEDNVVFISCETAGLFGIRTCLYAYTIGIEFSKTFSSNRVFLKPYNFGLYGNRVLTSEFKSNKSSEIGFCKNDLLESYSKNKYNLISDHILPKLQNIYDEKQSLFANVLKPQPINSIEKVPFPQSNTQNTLEKSTMFNPFNKKQPLPPLPQSTAITTTKLNNLIPFPKSTNIIDEDKQIIVGSNNKPKLEPIIRPLTVQNLQRGSYGQTSLVSDGNTKYVVKTLLPKHNGNTKVIENFKQEKVLLNSLEHKCNPYIVCPHTIPTKDQDLFKGLSFGMEYINGVDMGDLITDWSSDDEHISSSSKIIDEIGCNFNNLLQIFMDIAQGLQIFHNQNLIYRDLKLQNIMVYWDKNTNMVRAKIIDLGMVCAENKCGGFSGSLDYVDTYVYKNDVSNKVTDVFSLGVVYLISLITFGHYCSLRDSNYRYKKNIDVLFKKLDEIFLSPPVDQTLTPKEQLSKYFEFGSGVFQRNKNNKDKDIKELVYDMTKSYDEYDSYSNCFKLVLSMIDPNNYNNRPNIGHVIVQLKQLNPNVVGDLD